MDFSNPERRCSAIQKRLMEGGQGKNENFAESCNFIKSARSPSSVWGYEMSPIKAKSIWYIPGFKLLVRHEVMYASVFSFLRTKEQEQNCCH